MTRFLVDTSVLVDVSKGVEPARSQFRELLLHEEVGVCAVQVAEFRTGIASGRFRDADELFRLLSYWDISERSADVAGALRRSLARRGIQIALPDALIAAVAWETGSILLTENPRHFPMARIEKRSLRSNWQ